MEAALSGRLMADAGVAAIVGDRVFWDSRPEGSELPALVMTMLNGEQPRAMRGNVSIERSYVQFKAIAEDKAAAVALRKAVIAVVEVEGIHGGVTFQAAQNIEHRGAPVNTNSAVIDQDIIDAVIFHY